MNHTCDKVDVAKIKPLSSENNMYRKAELEKIVWNCSVNFLFTDLRFRFLWKSNYSKFYLKEANVPCTFVGGIKCMSHRHVIHLSWICQQFNQIRDLYKLYNIMRGEGDRMRMTERIKERFRERWRERLRERKDHIFL